MWRQSHWTAIFLTHSRHIGDYNIKIDIRKKGVMVQCVLNWLWTKSTLCHVSWRKNTAGTRWAGRWVEFTLPAGKRSLIVKLQTVTLLSELHQFTFISRFWNFYIAPKWGNGSFSSYLWTFCVQQLSLKPEAPLYRWIRSPFLWVSSFLFSPYSAYLSHSTAVCIPVLLRRSLSTFIGSPCAWHWMKNGAYFVVYVAPLEGYKKFPL